MISKKRLLSVAAAVALSSSMVSGDYLPLTSSSAENKWVMFGVAGYHANGATAAAGGIEAGMFSISDDAANVARDTGGDELYGEEGLVPTGEAILDGANVLASVKRVDGTVSEVEVRVDVSNITYYETDPVRTIYVKYEEDDAPLFAFTYKSALEGERLEFTTTSSAATDDAYFITINSENTYNNPAIATYVPAVDPSGADSGVYLTAIDDVVDYDFTDGPEAPNPILSQNYLQIDHQDIASATENIRLYAYNPSGIWEMYDSRNSFQDFDTLQKGKGYWGKMDLDAATPAGLVLGAPSITTQDYLDSGIAEGWNLLAFNAQNADLRVATTGLVASIAAGDIILTDVSGNHSVTITLASAVAADEARVINQAVKVAKINGEIPDTFNIIAIPTAADTIAFISDEKFTLFEAAAGVLGSPTTLAGGTPLNATTLEDHVGLADLSVDGAMSKYGEYALAVTPENAAFAVLDLRCDSSATQLVAPTVAGIGAATCIDVAYDLDTDYDTVLGDNILMVAAEPFEVRDHTFTRVFDYQQAEGDGEITIINGDAFFTTPVAIPGGAIEVFTVDFGALTAGQTLTVAGITITEDDVDTSADGATAAEVAASFASLNAGDAANTGAGTAANTVAGTLTGYSSSAAVGTVVTFTATGIGAAVDETLAGTGAGASTLTVTTQGVDATADATAAVVLLDAGDFTTGNDVLVSTDDKIIFRMKEANSNEFRVLETGDADNLTPTSTTDSAAKGAISDVYSPNYLVNAALTNETVITLTDNVDPVAGDTVTVTVTTPLVAALALEPYTVVATDVGDSDLFYANLQTHINAELDAKGLDTLVAITGIGGVADYSATLTFTGTDITAVASLGVVGTFAPTEASNVSVNGTPTIGTGDITEDLKYNFALSPNYVLDGPLYEMKDAGFTALAMVTGTMNLTGDTMNWDGIDLTRKPSEWLDSQDYNLFTVDEQAGYWTFLEAADANPLSFDAASFTANYTQHFNQDGTTFNQVGGGLEISVYGISDYDDRKSARVVAVVGGSEVELSRDGTSDVYTGQISSYELKEMTAGKEYDIQVIVADGLGYRIPATTTGVAVDFKKPAEPVVTFNEGTVTIANDATDGVTKYYLFNGDIPAQNTEAAVISTIDVADAASYNLCGSTTSFSRTGSYDLKLIALDGNNLATSNASNAYILDAYAPLFKNSAIITNTMDTAPSASLADVYYDSSCTVSEVAYDQSVQASSYTNLRTIKVAYEPKTVGTGNPITVFVDGGTVSSNIAAITYNEDYAGDVVFVQLGTNVFSYTLPIRTTAEASTEANPIDMNTAGTYLPGQSLGE